MKNIYTPAEIERILAASLGEPTVDERGDDNTADSLIREAFIDEVGYKVAEEVMGSRRRGRTDVLVFAGSEICGAYGLRAAARLHSLGCPARVILFNIGGQMLSADAEAARDAFVAEAGAEFLNEIINPGGFSMPDMDRHTIVVDAIFGSEYKRPLKGGYQAVARHINEHDCFVISVDLPSGMITDPAVGMINRNIVHADLTLTLVGPTLSFFMPENAQLVGNWKILPVSYDTATMAATRCSTRMVDAKVVRSLIPARNAYASKADLGDALIFAGSYGMLGAAVLATTAATRSGCGRVTCHGPRCAFYVMQSSVPSAMFTTDGGDTDIRRFENPRDADAIAIGPGIGRSEATVRGLEAFLQQSALAKKPLILDADALNCISQRPTMLDFIPARSIITPHAGEFDRLFGSQSSHSSRLLKAMEVAARYKIIVVLKGHFTFTVWPDGSILVNPTGTPALATAGSGDVLTGLMAGFVARHMAPEIAAVAAVFVHGIAGQKAAAVHGIDGTTAQDVAAAIGPAIESIVNPTNK